ncbi:MAG: amidohydrolase [Endomicrobium sp.]|jgi:amidohydrolase|nr:amidohydrolase [Endomicrobium sp.]
MNFEQEVLTIRRHVHKNPELGGNEYETAKFIESNLKELNIPYKRIGKTGVIATINTTKRGKTIALRADIDALPICENNDVEYKSTKSGIMHACGHDAHIAVVLGVAKLLQSRKNKLKGNVRFIFQPNEETFDGAKVMIECGALKNPNVNFILGIHVYPWLKSGKIGFKFGTMMAAVDKIKVKIIGLVTHGAYPHKGKDALVITSIFVNMVQEIISREIDPLEGSVITFGKITGGDAYNIICKEVTLEGTVRTFSNEVRHLIRTSILNKIKSLEIAYGVKCTVQYQVISNTLVNNDDIVQQCIESAKEFYGNEKVEIMKKPSMGGEDFSEYLDKVPGNFIYIGTSGDKHTSYPWHHTNFNIDESALPKAAKYIAYTVEKNLNK